MASTADGRFTADGTRYLVSDPLRPARADADLWNDSLYLRLDQRGRVDTAGFMQPNMTPYAGAWRAFYLRDDDSGAFWSAPFEPVQARPDVFEFSIGAADVSWRVERDGIRVDLQCFVPRDAPAELWTCTLTNVSRRRRRLSCFPCFPVGVLGLLAQSAAFDRKLGGGWLTYFPYYVKHGDYDALNRRRNAVFCVADRTPAGGMVSMSDFVGNRQPADPAALDRARLPRDAAPAENSNEPAAFVFQFAWRLAPGAQRTVRLVMGPAHDRREALRLKRRYFAPGGFDRARRAAQAFLDRHASAVSIRTPDRAFDHFVNHWLSRRSLMLARTIRFNMAPQGRNVIQDAMGSAYTDPEAGRTWFLRIWAHQRTDGWLPHGMPFAEGVQQIEINQIPHKDINAWGPTALSVYMDETGDTGLLDAPVAFADAPRRRAPLYNHVCLGLEWLWRDRTRRGLSRIGQGDWNDPLNMAGLEEKGESIWLSCALALALDAWAAVAARRGDTARAARYRRRAARLRAAVNRYGWDGRWYVRGFTDAGQPFGSAADREGRIFLNAQSWAIMCGAAGPERTRSCIRSVERMLMTPAGPVTLAPAYTRMHTAIGKLTQKVAGWNENGSVYCHAATFYACALYAARSPDKAFDALRRLLPGHPDNPVARCGQVPLYIPNFYRGAACGRKAGLSSHFPNTGTVSWYYRTVVAMLLGVRAEPDGLRIDPQLPSHWKRADVRRTWRGAVFDVRIRRRAGERGVTVRLDGRRLPDNLLPVQRRGTRHVVSVTLGA